MVGREEGSAAGEVGDGAVDFELVVSEASEVAGREEALEVCSMVSE